MKNTLSCLLYVGLLVTIIPLHAQLTNDSSSSSECASCNACHTSFIAPSSGDDIVQDFLIPFQPPPEKECFWFRFSTSLKYNQSFLGKRIAQNIFGSDTLNFIGAQATANDLSKGCLLSAENFGLSPQSMVSLTLDPSIKRFITRFQLHCGLDEWVNGWWFKIVLPIEYTQWDLHACSTTLTTTLNQTPFSGGCVSKNVKQSVDPAVNIKTALSGNFLFGDMLTPWETGHFKFESPDETALADVHFYIGFDLVRRVKHHLGIYLVAVAPTGDNPHVSTVFMPFVGNGHHVELGAGFDLHRQLWHAPDDQILVFHCAGQATHMFKRYQSRIFDLNNHGCMSRYQLMKAFTQADNTFVYKDLINGVNVLTRHGEITIPIKGEAAFEIRYHHPHGVSAGIGYDIYGRAREKICNIRPLSSTVGIKGCTPVAVNCFPTTEMNGIPVISSSTVTGTKTLAATQSNAAIGHCGDTDNAVAQVVTTNPGSVCVNSCTNTTELKVGTQVADVAVAQDSNPPLLLQDTQLDINSALAGPQLSHKMFFHIDYTWLSTDWLPFISFGAEVQVAPHHYTSALSQWGVWLQGGFEL
ncbi:MAG: hypothetical protein WA432_03775 [Candidatus Babeliaceae bacterium]